MSEKDLVLILDYLDGGPVGVGDTLMREALQRLVPEQTERIMGKWTQTYFDQGKAEGRTEGGAKVLARLIEKRFGAVSPQLRRRIFSADVATLEAWAVRVSDAPDLRSVFESN